MLNISPARSLRWFVAVVSGAIVVGLALTGLATPRALAVPRVLAFSQQADPSSDDVDPALTQVVAEDEEQAAEGTAVELSAGHVDLGPRLVDGEWALLARDDTEVKPVWRNIDDIVFRVSDAALLDVPDDETYAFTGATGKRVWVVPQQEIPGALWLGWNTQDPGVVESVTSGVSLIFEGHQGPGQFSVFVQAGNFSGPQELWNSTRESGQPINVELATHTHANWIFTEPGTHLIRLTAQAELDDGTLASSTQILRFAVGDDTPADDAANAIWAETTEPAAPATIIERNALDESSSATWLLAGGLALVAVIVAGGVAVMVRSRTRTKRAAAAMSEGGEL